MVLALGLFKLEQRFTITSLCPQLRLFFHRHFAALDTTEAVEDKLLVNNSSTDTVAHQYETTAWASHRRTRLKNNKDLLCRRINGFPNNLIQLAKRATETFSVNAIICHRMFQSNSYRIRIMRMFMRLQKEITS